MLPIRRQLLIKATKCTAALALAGQSAGAVAKAGATASESKDANLTRQTATLSDSGCNPILNHELRPLMGPEKRSLCAEYSDQVLLFVNTASRCGFTPQFEGLEKLHQKYSAKGFKVLGFPSGDFRQELESEAEVAEFCELNYGVSFPMFEKIHVTGEQAHPLYEQLASAVGTYPAWNFNKYLVDRTGNVVAHFGAGTKPMSAQMVESIEALL